MTKLQQNYYMPMTTVQKLDSYCNATGLGKSFVVEKAILEYLTGQTDIKSDTNLIKDLAYKYVARCNIPRLITEQGKVDGRKGPNRTGLLSTNRLTQDEKEMALNNWTEFTRHWFGAVNPNDSEIQRVSKYYPAKNLDGYERWVMNHYIDQIRGWVEYDNREEELDPEYDARCRAEAARAST